jgi:NitT/TauT family transport system substrate-binding protein
MRTDWVFSGYHAPFFVGVKNGYYRDEGLEVTVEPGNGSGNVAQAIGNGNGHFGAVDGGTMMNLVSKGLQVKAIMGILQRSPLAAIVNTKSGIKEPKDLEGKSLAATNGDALMALFPAFVEASGIDKSKVTLINADAASKNAIMISGRADAILTFNFLAVPPLQAAGLEVATLDYADYGVNVPGLSLIASNSYIEQNPEIVEKFVRATVKAYDWSIQHPEQAIDILVEMNPGQKIVKETALPILTMSFDLLHSANTAGKPTGVMAREDWAKAEEILAKYLGMTPAASPDPYFTNDFVMKQ